MIRSTCGYLRKDGQWLMLLRNRKENDVNKGKWIGPGGKFEAGEDAEACMKRELLEETGCKAGKLTKLGVVNPNPALFSNHVHFYLAQDLESTNTQNLDNDEFVNVIKVPVADIKKDMGSEQFPHALMSTAMMFYLTYLP